MSRDVRLAAWSPDQGSADLSTGREETTAALTYPGLSWSHAKSFLSLTPWTNKFLHKPENVCMFRVPGSVLRVG